MRKAILSISLFILIFTCPSFGQTTDTDQLIKEGVALHDKGNYREAIEKYIEALKINSQSMKATYELSLSYLALKDYKNAMKYSTTVINSNDKLLSPGAYAVKSEALAETGKVDEAIELLKEGLVKNGDAHLLHFNMALNYYKKGNTENSLRHAKKAIDLNKSHSGSFLLNAYLLNDKGWWIESCLSFQMFLLLEPDSERSKAAFEELLRTMQIKKDTEPIHRSFVQEQISRVKTNETTPKQLPLLTTDNGIDYRAIYQVITTTLDSLNNTPAIKDDFILFKTVNGAILRELENESKTQKKGTFWTFYVPFFSRIRHSEYFDAFCHYISVSYFPESFDWWQNNTDAAINFILWFEKGNED